MELSDLVFEELVEEIVDEIADSKYWILTPIITNNLTSILF